MKTSIAAEHIRELIRHTEVDGDTLRALEFAVWLLENSEELDAILPLLKTAAENLAFCSRVLAKTR